MMMIIYLCKTTKVRGSVISHARSKFRSYGGREAVLLYVVLNCNNDGYYIAVLQHALTHIMKLEAQTLAITIRRFVACLIIAFAFALQ